jgi:predicted phage terminase large subunit-like protein
MRKRMTKTILSKAEEAALEWEARNRARSNFRYFVTYTMPHYKLSWHNKLLLRTLNDFSQFKIPRLMIFMPPRHGKSQIVSRHLPAYLLGAYHDNMRIIQASYGKALANSMASDVYKIMQSPEYSNLFPDTLLPRRNSGKLKASEVKWHENFSYRVNGIKGPLTGFGMDVGIIDDPVKDRKEASSPTEQQNVIDWYNSTFYTRGSSNAVICLTMTRWHENDLAGYLLRNAKEDPKADQWKVITLPAVAEEPLMPYDKRHIGEALWTDQYPIDKLSKIKATMGRQEWLSLMQQRPTSAEGNIFERVWFEGNEWEPSEDSAYTAVELLNDYSLGLIKTERKRVDFPNLLSFIQDTAREMNRDGRLKKILIEDKGSGTSAFQTLYASASRDLKDLLFAVAPIEKKEQRASMASVWCRNGMVRFPKYFDDPDHFKDELFGFPSAQYDDRVDSFSQVINYLEHYLSLGYSKKQGWATQ